MSCLLGILYMFLCAEQLQLLYVRQIEHFVVVVFK